MVYEANLFLDHFILVNHIEDVVAVENFQEDVDSVFFIVG